MTLYGTRAFFTKENLLLSTYGTVPVPYRYTSNSHDTQLPIPRIVDPYILVNDQRSLWSPGQRSVDPETFFSYCMHRINKRNSIGASPSDSLKMQKFKDWIKLQCVYTVLVLHFITQSQHWKFFNVQVFYYFSYRTNITAKVGFKSH
jgi:hypothetical protein